MPVTAGARSDTRIARTCALVSGVAGLVAGLLLIGFFALAGHTWLGTANDVVGIVQFAAFAPVIWALHRRLPVTRWLRAVTVVAVAGAIALAVLGVLLVTDVLTYQQQIGPVIVTILLIYAWLLAANLAAHRFRTLPRAVTLSGVMLAVGFLTGMVLVGASLVLTNPVGQIIGWAGQAVAFLGWLGLPVYSLLLAARVFTGWGER